MLLPHGFDAPELVDDADPGVAVSEGAGGGGGGGEGHSAVFERGATLADALEGMRVELVRGGGGEEAEALIGARRWLTSAAGTTLFGEALMEGVWGEAGVGVRGAVEALAEAIAAGSGAGARVAALAATGYPLSTEEEAMAAAAAGGGAEDAVARHLLLASRSGASAAVTASSERDVHSEFQSWLAEAAAALGGIGSAGSTERADQGASLALASRALDMAAQASEDGASTDPAAKAASGAGAGKRVPVASARPRRTGAKDFFESVGRKSTKEGVSAAATAASTGAAPPKAPGTRSGKASSRRTAGRRGSSATSAAEEPGDHDEDEDEDEEEEETVTMRTRTSRRRRGSQSSTGSAGSTGAKAPNAKAFFSSLKRKPK
jgi:hypothetical protein